MRQTLSFKVDSAICVMKMTGRRSCDIAANNNLVFVYGTLKNGQPNHYLLTDPKEGTAELVEGAETREKYPLVIASKYNIPFLLDKPGIGHHVKGEVYSVCERMMGCLDELECHPTYYVRRLEPVKLLEQNLTKFCWTYFLPKFRNEILNLPHYKNYSSFGDHGLPYVLKYERHLANYSPRDDVYGYSSEETASQDDLYDD